MADPFAPPGEAPPRARRPFAGYAPAEAWDEPEARHDASVARERRDRPWRDAQHRPEPARPGVFWTVAAVGIGVLCLARLLLFFALDDDLPGDQVAPALLGVLGLVTLAAGLALAAILQRGLAVPWRIALLLGAGFFATVGAWGGLTGSWFL